MNSRRGWRDHPLVQLTLVRYREFYREPEALFWVFIFPILMACALGVAFRARGDEPVVVGVVETAVITRSGGGVSRTVMDRAL